MRSLRHHLYTWKQWTKSLFRYPPLLGDYENYNEYWHQRKLTKDSMNEFQEERALLTLAHVQAGKSIMDIGVGNGAVLSYIHQQKPMTRCIGIDVSDVALALARENGIEGIKIDMSKEEERDQLPNVDYICLFEVLEHVPRSEELLAWAVSRAREGVFFSVPNTGFFIHRLRLLLGRFPLQWRAHPSEHVRFWTLRDMRWWLLQLHYSNYQLVAYQGIPFLKILWPSLAAQGLFVYLPKK